MVENLMRWFVFSVLVALLPLVLNALIVATDAEPFSLVQLVARGELLIIAAALCAGAIGDLIGRGTQRASAKIVAGGACVMLLFLN